MFRWKRAFSYQLIVLIITGLTLGGCSGTRLNWMSKKAEVDYQTLKNPQQYQQDYIECNSYSRAYRNGYATVATSTGIGTLKGAASSQVFPAAGIDSVTNVGAGLAGGALGSFIWSSWVLNHKINRDTAMCLIGRGYTIIDQEWWEDMYKYNAHGS